MQEFVVAIELGLERKGRKRERKPRELVVALGVFVPSSLDSAGAKPLHLAIVRGGKLESLKNIADVDLTADIPGLVHFNVRAISSAHGVAITKPSELYN